jgi:hypothetical protein
MFWFFCASSSFPMLGPTLLQENMATEYDYADYASENLKTCWNRIYKGVCLEIGYPKIRW